MLFFIRVAEVMLALHRNETMTKKISLGKGLVSRVLPLEILYTIKKREEDNLKGHY